MRSEAGRGLSLVEFLAACVVTGILIVLVLGVVVGARERTRMARAMERCRELSAAAQRYEMETGRELRQLSELVESDVEGWNGPYAHADDGFCDPWGSRYVVVREGDAVQVVSSNVLGR
ncbi:MAG: type II secretion system protein GspG [bacterium]|nr:type II secretion system protein GspG [bacterium]